MQTITIEKKTGFIIKAQTGCSCCKEENFIEGIFKTDEKALEFAMALYEEKAVASQYYPNGYYSIEEIEYEELSDNRIIIGSRIFEGDSDSLWISSWDGANDIDGKQVNVLK